MSSFNKIEKTYIRNTAKILAVVLLAAAYISGNSPGEAFHKFFHNQETLVHTVDQEKDSCHRTIYHQEKEDGCKHKTHISKVEQCTLCHALSHIDQIVISDSTCEFISTDVEIVGKIISHHFSLADTNLPARAPPVA
ncbi:MAG: hypothetical protein JNM78_03490 [Cyclobacteriaceae bacterium]|nr:hypothetical protein [Cyclobacteriaceae bacterium]